VSICIGPQLESVTKQKTRITHLFARGVFLLVSDKFVSIWFGVVYTNVQGGGV